MQKELISNLKEQSKFNEFRNEKNKVCNKENALSNITKSLIFSKLKVNNLYLEYSKIETLIPSLYKGLKSKYPNVSKLEVKSKEYIFNVLETFLNKKFDLYKIDFLKNGEIRIYKELSYKSMTLWFIEFEKIFILRRKAPKLYILILSFLKNFNIIYNSTYVDYANELVEDEIVELSNIAKTQKDLDYIKKLKYEHKGYKKIRSEFEKKLDLSFLQNYKPKKKLYKQIFDLLNNSDIDFNIIFNLEIPSSFFEENDNAVLFHDMFGFVFNQEHIYKDYIESNITSIYNEYGIVPPIDMMIIKNGRIMKNFSSQENDITKICDFFTNLIILINKI